MRSRHYVKLNFGLSSCCSKRAASTGLCKPVVNIKDETRVWLGGCRASYLEGVHLLWGEWARLDIGFLVKLGWASLIIAPRGKGQFAFLLFSRMFKFLFVSGPVMYLKHMGTPATICPKSHILSTSLTMWHFDGEQRGGGGGWLRSPSASLEHDSQSALAGGCRGSRSA